METEAIKLILAKNVLTVKYSQRRWPPVTMLGGGAACKSHVYLKFIPLPFQRQGIVINLRLALNMPSPSHFPCAGITVKCFHAWILQSLSMADVSVADCHYWLQLSIGNKPRVI